MIALLPAYNGLLQSTEHQSQQVGAAPLAYSWNSKVSCIPKIVRISDITDNMTGANSFNNSPFSPGISENPTVPGSLGAKRWLTPGTTPPNWHSPGPACTITNSKGVIVASFVEIDGIGRSTWSYEDNRTHYDAVNGGTVFPPGHWGDSTGNLFDPAIVPNYSGSCATAMNSTCYGRIHSEFDGDWLAAGYCGTGTACDNNTFVQNTKSGSSSTLVDVQGFVYWDQNSMNFSWHSFSGWEIHPLTAWRLHQVPQPDFSLSASPISLTVAQGGVGSSTVNLVSQNGFVGMVALSASPNASGLSASCNPSSISLGSGQAAASTCSFMPSNLGTFNVTVKGSSGTLSHSQIINVRVAPNSLVTVVTGTNGILYASSYSGAWSNWTSLSGATSSPPTVCPSTPGRVELVVRGSDNIIYHKSFINGSWANSWNSPGGLTNDQPSCAVLSGRLYVVIRGLDNRTYLNSMSLTLQSWQGWQSLNLTAASGPLLAVSSGTTLELLVRGMDNGIYHRSLSISTGLWSKVDSPGGATDDAFTAASDGTALHVVVRGVDNRIYYNNLTLSTGSWGSWQALNGTTPTPPSLVIDALGTIHIVVRGFNNIIYHIAKPHARGWESTWNSLQGQTPDRPALSANSSSIQLLVRGMDNGSYYNNLVTSAWTGWKALGGATPITPALTAIP